MKKAKQSVQLAACAFLVLALVLFSTLYQYDDDTIGQFRVGASSQKQGTQQVMPQELTVTSERVVYVYGAGLVARKDSSGVTYQHQDFLSSNRFASDSNGRLVSRSVQEPYGSTFEDVGTSAALRNDYTFTGKEQDERLYYFGARYYDPRTARFVSTDPIQRIASPYSYAANNPLKFTDPPGMAEDPLAATNYEQHVQNMQRMEQLRRAQQKRLLISLGVTVGVGCITAICTSGLSLPLTTAQVIAIGAGEGAAVSVTTDLLLGERDPTLITENAVISGGAGGATAGILYKVLSFARSVLSNPFRRAVTTAADDAAAPPMAPAKPAPAVEPPPPPAFRSSRQLDPYVITSQTTGNRFRFRASHLFERGRFVRTEQESVELLQRTLPNGQEIWEVLSPARIKQLSETAEPWIKGMINTGYKLPGGR